MTQTGVADAFGVDVRTIRRWTADGMPRAADGGYNLTQCITWRRGQDLVEVEEKVMPPDLKEVRLRYEHARATKMETDATAAAIALANEQNRLMSIEEYGHALDSAFSRVRARLENLPPRLASLVVGVPTPAEAHDLIEPVVDELVEELYRGEDVPDDVEDEPPSPIGGSHDA